MTQKELLTEKWTTHQWHLSTGKKFYYIGPEHGRTVYSQYDTLEAARAALEMRTWIAKKMKTVKKATQK
jgi:hypothetical protein